MLTKTIFLIVLCVVTIYCDDSTRIKRTKYSYPTRFYRLPPPPHIIKGPFSYTPPPGYMNEEDRPYIHKVSKKPSNDGLADEDISNLVKHLSKKDLNKIVEFASEKDRYANRYKEDFYGYDRPGFKTFKRPDELLGLNSDDEKLFEKLLNKPFLKDSNEKYNKEYTDQSNVQITRPIYLDSDNPNLNYVNDASQNKAIYANPPNYKVISRNPEEFNLPEITKAKVVPIHVENNLQNNIKPVNPNPVFNNPKITYTSVQEIPYQINNIQNPNQYYSNVPNTQMIYSNQQQFNRNTNQGLNPNHFNTNLETGESKRQYITYVTVPPENIDGALFTSSETMQEEQLPKPLNLREDYYEASNTEHVEKVVKSDSYKVESFKELPLMDEYQNSKLHMVSSYNVPHYTVTHTKSQQASQQSSYGQSSPIQAPVIEKAPPGYTGKEMSDAHLKAVKIWTHRSRGTAYTLHDDGTLSLEKPKIKTSYGYA